MISQKKINLHTHTNYCDGQNTAEEMILSAIEKKFSVLGFSSHSMYPFASDWHIAPREHEKYVSEIRALSEKYKDQITVYCGFEVDYIPSFSIPEKSHFGTLKPDFLIGSVHYIVNEKGQFGIDDKTENVAEGIKNLYAGNGKKVVCDYFELQRQMLQKGSFEIWGHPDLARKRNDILKFFNEKDSWYINELKETVKVAAKASVVAEINTGAIARGAMDDVYPSEYFLSLLKEAGIPVCINSDCHNAPDLDCAYERAASIAKKIGYSELIYPVAGKTYSVKL